MRLNVRSIHWQFWAVVGVLFVGIALRGWALGQIPLGLNQDEAASGYDSYALLTEGIDRTGLRFPVHLPSWGSGMNALAAYLTMPSIAAFGLSPFSIRFPFFLAGVGSLLAFASFLHRIADRKTALIGMVLLALNPWHIMVSRWALESNMFPMFFLFAVASLHAAIARKKTAWAVASGILFGACLYAYGIAYAVVPIFLVLAIGALLWWKKLSIRNTVVLCASAVIVGTPIALFVFINAFGLPTIVTPFFTVPRLTTAARFLTAGTIDNGDFFSGAGQRLMHLVGFLGSEGDGTIWNGFAPYGLFGGIGVVLAFVGIGVLLRGSVRRSYRPGIMLLFWLLACIPVALFTDINVNRINILMLPLIACAAIALRALLPYRILFSVLMLTTTIASGSFAAAYFTRYAAAAESNFVSSIHEAVKYAAHNVDGPICVTDRMNMSYIHALFATKTPPNVFASTVLYANPGQEYQVVRSFGRYVFGTENCDGAVTDAYVLRTDEPLPAGVNAASYAIRRFPKFSTYLR